MIAHKSKNESGSLLRGTLLNDFDISSHDKNEDESSPLLRDTLLNDFYIALYDEIKNIKNPENTKRNAVLSASNYILGILGSIWTFPLSYKFGKFITQEKQIPSYIIAGLAFVSTIALFTNLMRLFTLKMLKFESRRIKNLQKSKKLKNITELLLWVFSLATTIPATYLAYDEFDKYIKAYALLIVIPTFLAQNAKNIWSLGNLIDFAIDLIKKARPQKKLSDKDKKRLALIKNMELFLKNSPDALENIEMVILKLLQCNENEKIEAGKKIFEIISNNTTFEVKDSKAAENGINIFEVLAGISGAFLGAIAAYSFYPLADDGVKLALHFLNLKNKKINMAFRYTLSSASYMFSASLFMFTGQKYFRGSYNNFMSRIKNIDFHKKNSKNETVSLTNSKKFYFFLKYSISILFAILGAGPLVVMTAEGLGKPLEDTKNWHWYECSLIIIAFLISFITKFWSIINNIDLLEKKIEKKSTPEFLPKISDFSCTFFRRAKDNVIEEIDNEVEHQKKLSLNL